METVKDRNTKPSKTGQTIELGVPKLDAEPETTSTNATTRPSFVPQYEPSTEKKFSSTSIPDRQWINDHLQTLNMSPLPGHEALSSTLKPVRTSTNSDEITMKGNKAPTSNAITTSATYTSATVTTRPNLRVFGDRQHEAPGFESHNRQVGYLPYVQPMNNTIQGHQSIDIALAIQQLASSNEIASLPKSELLTFDSSSKN